MLFQIFNDPRQFTASPLIIYNASGNYLQSSGDLARAFKYTKEQLMKVKKVHPSYMQRIWISICLYLFVYSIAQTEGKYDSLKRFDLHEEVELVNGSLK